MGNISKVVLLFAFLVLNQTAKALPNSGDTTSYFGVDIGMGAGRFMPDFPSVPNSSISRYNPVFTAKFYWQSPYKLQFGLESGYYDFYTTTLIQQENEIAFYSKSNLSCIPIMININMQIWNYFFLGVSTGPVIMLHSTDSYNNTVSGTLLSALNYSLSAAYLYPIAERISLGLSCSNIYLGKTTDNYLSLKLDFVWRFCKF